MDLQKKVQDVLDQAVENGTECGCQAALFINGKLEVNACRLLQKMVLACDTFQTGTNSKSNENFETALGRNSGCNYEWNIEQCNRRSKQQNRGHQTFCMWIQKQGQFQNSDPLSLRETGSDAGNGEVTRKYLIFPTGHAFC